MKRRLARTQIAELEKDSTNGEVRVYIENILVDMTKMSINRGRQPISAPVGCLFANSSRIGSDEILALCLPLFAG
jgi:hypothetical protein